MTDLRNPSLKSRHWSLIEEVIGHRFDPEVPLTLTFLQELEAFNYAEAIQEISGQASSEASLEAILKKARSRYTPNLLVIVDQSRSKNLH